METCSDREDLGFMYRCVRCGCIRFAAPSDTTPICCGAAMQPAIGLDFGAR